MSLAQVTGSASIDDDVASERAANFDTAVIDRLHFRSFIDNKPSAHKRESFFLLIIGK